MPSKHIVIIHKCHLTMQLQWEHQMDLHSDMLMCPLEWV